MKIDPTSVGALIERMRAAQLQGPTAGQPAGIENVAHAKGAESAQLEGSMRATAERALRGEFASVDELRGAVVEQIVAQRWSDRVAKSKLSELTDALKQSLVDDPEFARQVDEMLILAASRLGPK